MSTPSICAFANTPKFNQVQKSSPSAHIVKKEWILDCHQNRTRHNLTNYSLIPLSDQTKYEPEIKASSEGDNSDANEPKSSTFSEKKESQTIRTSRNTSKARGQMKEEESDSAYDVETDEEYDPYQDMENEDDQLVSMPTKPTKKETPDKTEALNLENVELPPLPDFFKRRKFFLFGSFDSELRRMMKRLIIAYNGVLMDYMGEDVNYIVTSESWSDKFDQVLEDNSSVQFVRPSWLTACDSQQKAVPLQYHLVPPT